MKINKKEIVIGILMPLIGVCAGLINAIDWPIPVSIMIFLVSFGVWFLANDKKKATLYITVIFVLGLVGLIFFTAYTHKNNVAKLEVEPIQIVVGKSLDNKKNTPDTIPVLRSSISDTQIARANHFSKTDFINNQRGAQLKVFGRTKNASSLLSSIQIDTVDWNVTQKTLSEGDEDEGISYRNVVYFGEIFDKSVFYNMYKGHVQFWDLKIADLRMDSTKSTTTFPLIICTIKNSGNNSGILYSLVSHRIAEVTGITAQDSRELIPLNKKCRLFPGRTLIFDAPILIPKNSIATIQFSPTFRSDKIYFTATPPYMLFSVSAIYFDGRKKEQLLLGYYAVQEAILDGWYPKGGFGDNKR